MCGRKRLATTDNTTNSESPPEVIVSLGDLIPHNTVAKYVDIITVYYPCLDNSRHYAADHDLEIGEACKR